MASPRDLGVALWGGRAGPGWPARAQAIGRLLAPRLGTDPPSLVLLPPTDPPPPGLRAAGPQRAARADALRLGEAFLQALFSGSSAQLRPLLAPGVWVLWPSGPLAVHPGVDVADHVGAHPPSRAPDFDRPRTASLMELRATLPRGIAEAVDAAADLHEALVLSFALVRRQPRRVSVLLRPEAAGWRVGSLLLPGIDEAFHLSDRSSQHEQPHLGAAGRVVRAILLGHGGYFRGAAHDLFPRFWLGEERLDPEALAARVDAAPIPLDRLELVFGRSVEVPWSGLGAKMPRSLADHFGRRALESLGDKLERLDPRVVETPLARVDPTTARPLAGGSATSVLLRGPDRRARVAAVFLP